MNTAAAAVRSHDHNLAQSAAISAADSASVFPFIGLRLTGAFVPDNSARYGQHQRFPCGNQLLYPACLGAGVHYFQRLLRTFYGADDSCDRCVISIGNNNSSAPRFG